MIIGVPKEIKKDENRVALLPVGAEQKVAAGVNMVCGKITHPGVAAAWGIPFTPLKDI